MILRRYTKPGQQKAIRRAANSTTRARDLCIYGAVHAHHVNEWRNQERQPNREFGTFPSGSRRLRLVRRYSRCRHSITALPYAMQDMFAFVLYFNQKLNAEQSEILRRTTVDLVDLAIALNGTYYLPYQLYYSSQQLRRAYGEIDAFFAAKKNDTIQKVS